MTDALNIIWELLDSPTLLVTHAEVLRWPPAAVAELTRLGFLREAVRVDHAACPNCPDRHVEEVLCRSGPDGQSRFYIPCPKNLRVEIAADSLRRWMIDVDAIARRLASAIAPSGRCTQRTALRLWRLGGVAWQGVNRDVLLARGLDWPDNGEIIRQIGGNGRSIVLLSGPAPPAHIWPELPPTVVSLPSAVRLQAGAITVALADICALVQDTDAANQALRPVALSRKQQKREFQKAAGDVLKSKLGDDPFVQAYDEHGSYRKAAEALSKQFGFPVSKDKVRTAVKRRGGVGAVERDTDSESVRRTVASQGRDRKRKFASPTQPPHLE
ncbi:MAG: hypothetical protein BroJett001_26500 [Chloroflexota bacterium]|nr:MAG: hypothetical protein BroJett001_26500 [Chloroflexota bacterium]